jgi:hypothetical protein
MEATFVKHLRIEGADRGMESPRFRQEEPTIRRNGRMRSENVVERRDINPVRVAALDRLLQLARIAQENDASRRLGDRENIGERHLRRLVDK